MRAESFAWERYFGAQTRRPVARDDSDLPVESRSYEPLPWFLLRKAMAALPFTRADVFVDLGAGLGRAVLMAASNPLRRVIGVELVDALAVQARHNVQLARHRLHAPVDIVTADATAWEVPGDASVVFLFNPFVGQVMADVQHRLAASLTRNPRKMRVLYAHADDQRDLFAGCSWLHLTQRIDVGVFKGMNVLLYEN